VKKEYYKSKPWLAKRYLTDKKTVEEIAKECNVTAMTVFNWLKKFDLIRESRTWKR
jgi:transposase-like protein